MTIPTPSPPNYLDDGAAPYAPTGGGAQTGFGQVGGAAASFNIGAGGTAWNGVVVVNVVAVDTSSTNELYQLEIQGSTTADFAATATLGLLTVAAPGQYEIPVAAFTAGVLYPYFRLAKHLTGTTPSITLSAFPLPFSGMDDLSLADLIKVNGLAAQNLTQLSAALLAWASGTATGGPNGDGRYPLYDAAGDSFLTLCPAAELLTAGRLDTLPLATQAEAAPNGVVSVTDPATGVRVLKRLNFYPARRTVDLDQRTQVVAADLLQLTANADGTPYKVPVSLLQTQLAGVINVRDVDFGAKGDYLEVRDAVADGSATLTSATNPWRAADVGKLIYVGNRNLNLTTAQRTIVAVNGPGSIVLSSAMPYSSGTLVAGWGTDDTAAIAAAFAAAAPPIGGAYAYGGVVLFPPGAYLTDAQQTPTRTALYGYGGRQSFLVRKPSATATPTLSNALQNDDFPIILNLGVYGLKTLNTSGSQRGYQFTAEPGNFTYPQGDVFPYWQGMQIWETTDIGFVQSGNAGGVMLGVQINNCATYGYKSAAFDMDISDLYIQGCSLGGLYTFSGAAGNNYSNCKISFNGAQASGSAIDVGMNIFVGGSGETFTNVRGQESYYSNWVIQGSSITMRACRAEDTGDISIQDGLGGVPLTTRPRAALQLDGNIVDNDLDLNVVHLIPFGHSQNCATHALFLSSTGGSGSYAEFNRLQMRTASAMRLSTSYWQGGPDVNGRAIPATTGAYAPALYGTDNPNGISNTNDDFKINGVQIA